MRSLRPNRRPASRGYDVRRDRSGDSRHRRGSWLIGGRRSHLLGVLRARWRHWAAARVRAVRPAPACRLDRRGADRIRADGFRIWAADRGRCSVEVVVPGCVAGDWGVDLGAWTGTPRAAHRAARMERPCRRRARLRAPPDAGACRAAIRPRGRAGRVRESVLPRVLHGRLRVAHRLDCGARQVLDAAAESLPRIRADSLLLDVLPAARRRVAGRTGQRAQRGVLFEGERHPHRSPPDLIGVHARVDDDPPAVGNGGCGLARPSRRQLRGRRTRSIDCGRAARASPP